MIINDNIAALNTFNALAKNTSAMNKALAQLSSGRRINSAADDASGLTISEQMIGQINGLNQANNNAQDGISLIQTAEGGLNATTSILQRMRELAVQAANGTNNDTDREAIQTEIRGLIEEINQIGDTTQFNTMNLLNGALVTGGSIGPLTLQVGANTGQNMTIRISSMKASGLGVNGVDVSKQSGAMKAITTITSGISQVSAMNSQLGAYQNRLSYISDNLSTSSQNLTSANAQIVDVDMAKEMSEYTKASILVQAATAMLAQAQQAPQSVLKLLG